MLSLDRKGHMMRIYHPDSEVRLLEITSDVSITSSTGIKLVSDVGKILSNISSLKWTKKIQIILNTTMLFEYPSLELFDLPFSVMKPLEQWVKAYGPYANMSHEISKAVESRASWAQKTATSDNDGQLALYCRARNCPSWSRNGMKLSTVAWAL